MRKFHKGLALIAGCQLLVNHAMSQSNCNPLRIAHDYVKARYPFIDLADTRPLVSSERESWEVRFDLPKGVLGLVPVVSIDRATCAVVQAYVEQ